MSVTLKINEKKLGYNHWPIELRSVTKKKIGSYFIRGTRTSARGLTPDQEKYLLPSILGVSPKSQEWEKVTKDYWNSFSAVVTSSGLTLDISLKEKGVKVKLDNGEEVVIDIPNNVEQYATYNMCVGIGHAGNPIVAKTEDEYDRMEHFDIVLMNDDREREKQETAFKMTEKATENMLLLFGEIKSKPEILDQVLYMVKQPHEYLEDLPEMQKKIYIKNIVDKDPKTFNDAFNTKELELKSLVIKAVEYGVIIKEGNKFFFDDQIIGEKIETAALHLKDPNNSKSLLVIRERIEDAKRNKNKTK